MAIFGGGNVSGTAPRMNLWGGGPQGSTSDPITDSYKLYNRSVEQGAEDYSSIMGAYRNVLKQQMGPNAEHANAVANLRNLSSTGGFAEGDIANIRERGLSPIRSIYAGANRDIDRQRSLQGGYSPNYGALKAKMARDLSTQLGDQISRVNADISGRQASNRISIAPNYAMEARQGPAMSADILRGMTSLYGTTPANAALFGNQAAQAAQLQNQSVQQSNARRSQAYGMFG